MIGHYDRDGNPIDQNTCVQLMEDSYIRVALGSLVTDVDELAGESGESVTVSTVWLGIDHSYGDGPPMIFETMIFGGPYDQEQMRYSTEADAIDGHRRVMEDLADHRAPWWTCEQR